MTPTFAAGLGIVIAALLAYPVSQLSLQYEQPKGQPCGKTGCPSPWGGGVGSLASAPAHRMDTRSPGHLRSPGSPSPAPSPASAGRPALTYQTVQTWNGRFLSELVITPSAPVPGSGWRLQISYPVGRIVGVWGGNWVRKGHHTALIEQAASETGPERSQIRIFVAVAGNPRPPVSAVFDGQICQIAAARRNSGGRWGSGTHNAGSRTGGTRSAVVTARSALVSLWGRTGKAQGRAMSPRRNARKVRSAVSWS